MQLMTKTTENTVISFIPAEYNGGRNWPGSSGYNSLVTIGPGQSETKECSAAINRFHETVWRSYLLIGCEGLHTAI